MNKRDCMDCLYGDVCPSMQACEDYVPEFIVEMDRGVERRRRDFRKEWILYMTRDDIDDRLDHYFPHIN